MLQGAESVNSGMYAQLHNAAQAMAALGQYQPLSIQPGDRLVLAVYRSFRLGLDRIGDLNGRFHQQRSFGALSGTAGDGQKRTLANSVHTCHAVFSARGARCRAVARWPHRALQLQETKRPRLPDQARDHQGTQDQC